MPAMKVGCAGLQAEDGHQVDRGAGTRAPAGDTHARANSHTDTQGHAHMHTHMQTHTHAPGNIAKVQVRAVGFHAPRRGGPRVSIMGATSSTEGRADDEIHFEADPHPTRWRGLRLLCLHGHGSNNDITRYAQACPDLVLAGCALAAHNEASRSLPPLAGSC